VLVDNRFQFGQLLAELIGIAQRVLVVVGDGDQECGNLDLVETVQAAAETPLAQIRGTNAHPP
jgi:hypothetical protein